MESQSHREAPQGGTASQGPLRKAAGLPRCQYPCLSSATQTLHSKAEAERKAGQTRPQPHPEWQGPCCPALLLSGCLPPMTAWGLPQPNGPPSSTDQVAGQICTPALTGGGRMGVFYRWGLALGQATFRLGPVRALGRPILKQSSPAERHPVRAPLLHGAGGHCHPLGRSSRPSALGDAPACC